MRSMSVLPIALWAAVHGGAALAQAGAAEVAMSTDEATAFVKGKTLSAVRVAGGMPSLQFKDDGAMYGSVTSGPGDSGKWRVEDGKLCMTWRHWDYEGCGQLTRVGDEVHHLYPNSSTVHLIFRR